MSRFIKELEFVQLLSNPQYLQFLAQSGYFDTTEFIHYLEYLMYFKSQKYSKFITFPYSLTILDLLQHKEFREKLKSFEMVQFLHQKQYRAWIHYLQLERSVYGSAGVIGADQVK
jgi:mediator of RNA polymerase II transcription subunit 31